MVRRADGYKSLSGGNLGGILSKILVCVLGRFSGSSCVGFVTTISVLYQLDGLNCASWVRSW